MRWLLILVVALFLLPVVGAKQVAEGSQGNYQGFADAGGFLNIVPPGQDGVLNDAEALQARAGQYPPHVKDQLSMYGDLVYNTPGLTEDRLSQFYKDASFGVREDDIDRVYSPTGGVIVVRDKSFGVPHIFGETRYATMFAQGYTGAEDRLFLMDVLRHLGRARLSEFLGASPANEGLDRDQLAVAPYREEDLTAQLQAIAAGPDGPALAEDLRGYIDGVNAYIREALVDQTKMPAEYPALQQVPQPWKPEDIVATASLVGAIFGKGGGGELRNFCGLKRMAAALGDATQARRVFDDLHFANDPEAPTTSSQPTPYMTDLGPVNPAALPDIDCESLAPIDDGQTSLDDLLRAISGGLGARQVDAPWGSFTLDFTNAMSNALLIAGDRTTMRRPIAVFGPQTGYFIPQLLVEKDVHGPGIDARGVAFAGTDLYVQLGRGANYAWSATSAGADNIDQWVLRLCEPGEGTPTPQSMGYEHNGVCEPVESYQHTQVAKPSAGGVPQGPDIVLSWRVDRTQQYGPLVARGRLTDGTPVAIASLRTTYGSELGSASAFFHINNPGDMAGGFDSFRQIMGTGVQYTFNWFYVDAKDIGYQHSCKCPQRTHGVDPYLPAWGTGEWDWQGFIPFEAQPWDKNPAKGYITSWNNKQAPLFTANDSNFSYGPVYRVQMLNSRIEAALAAGKVDRADIVEAMEDAGTVDLRGQEVLPLLLQAMGARTPPGDDPRAQEMRDRLAAWVADASHRRDHDHSGEYDDPQSPAIIDAWWPLLAHAIFDSASGNAINNLGIELDDANRRDHLGSAFQGAIYPHVQKDIRQVLGLPLAQPFSRTYCGAGDPTVCRAILWQSLSDAAKALEKEFSSPNVADWKRQIADEDVRHQAVGVTEVPPIHWINRPTFQQVVQVGVPVPAGDSFGAGSLAAAAGGKIGFTYKIRAFVGGSGDGRFRLRDFEAGHAIDITQVRSARSPAGSGCGNVPAGGPNTFEFSGSANFDGAGGQSVHVCVQDNGDPGGGRDVLHVDCSSCPYNTQTAAAAELLAAGNLKVHGGTAPAPAPGGASVVSLEPALGLSTNTLPASLTATVYDAFGQPVPGVPVVLKDPTGLLSLTSVADAGGTASFALNSADALLREWTATVAGLESNPVRLR